MYVHVWMDGCTVTITKIGLACMGDQIFLPMHGAPHAWSSTMVIWMVDDADNDCS